MPHRATPRPLGDRFSPVQGAGPQRPDSCAFFGPADSRFDLAPMPPFALPRPPVIPNPLPPVAMRAALQAAQAGHPSARKDQSDGN